MEFHNMKGSAMEGDLTSDKYISLDDAKGTIITALNQFHTKLGTRAAEILYNEEPFAENRNDAM